jgi:UDP:flavonoid glycosyltransferase YjiC (YdhE family)
MIGVASTGLPHLMLPMAADHFENADMIGGRGLGAVLEPPDVSAEAVASGIAQLDDDDVRARAEVTATEIAAMPGPDDAVGLLEQLVTGRRASG